MPPNAGAEMRETRQRFPADSIATCYAITQNLATHYLGYKLSWDLYTYC